MIHGHNLENTNPDKKVQKIVTFSSYSFDG